MDLCQQPKGSAALDEGFFKLISEKVDALFLGSGVRTVHLETLALLVITSRRKSLLAHPSDEDKGGTFSGH